MAVVVSLLEEELLLLGHVLDAEDTNTLGLEGHNSISLLVSRIRNSRRTRSCFPVELRGDHILIVLVVAQVAFSDLNVGIVSTGVAGGKQVQSVRTEVEHRGGLWRFVEKVSNILNADEEVVLALREHVNLQLTIEGRDLSRMSLGCDLNGALRHEELDGLILEALYSTLERFTLRRVEELDAEASVDLNAFTASVSFVKRLFHATGVVAKETAVDHDLHLTFVNDRAALGAIVHDGDLSASLALHNESRLDRVVVTGNRLVSREVEVRSVIENTRLHLKAIAVSVECL